MTNNLTINLIADNSVSSAPAGFVTAVQEAASMIEAAFHNPITINIDYGWGVINTGTVSAPQYTSVGATSAEGGPSSGNLISYSALKSLLDASATSADDQLAYSNLPASTASFPNSSSEFYIASAQEKALNDFSGSASALDGAIGFGTSTTSAAWLPMALHEIAHAMGRISLAQGAPDPAIMDLFRYSSQGVYQWTSGAPAYFSINGGATDIADFSTISDDADWNGDSRTANDPFNYQVGSTQTLTAKDIEMLDVMGFNTVAVVPTLVNDVPARVNPGGKVVISQSLLQFSDSLSAAAQLTYTLLGGPSGGSLLVNGLAASSFTQAQINQGLVAYQETSATATADSFAFQVTDSAGDVSSPQSFSIQILRPGSISVESGGTVVIPQSQLDFADPTGTPAQDVYTITSAPVGGNVFKNGAVTTSFTQADIDNGLITYWNATIGTTTNLMSFTVTNSLGVKTGVESLTINGFNALPAVDNLATAGDSDIVWRNLNGDVAIWNSTGASSTFNSASFGYVSTDWQIVGVGLFNSVPTSFHDPGYPIGDGFLWWNSSSDQLTTWNAPAGAPESFSNGPTYQVRGAWSVAGVGDFNGDGFSDVLFRSATGGLDIWAGGSVPSAGTFTAQPVMNVSSDWVVQDVGDFNGAGKDGILWRNANSGDVTIWDAGAAPNSFGSVDLGAVGSNWSIAGIGDFVGSGREDILWRSTSGDVAVWAVNASGTGYHSVDLGHVSTDWTIQNVGDYNNDGKADIVWRNTSSGAVTVWDSTAAPFGFNSVNQGNVSTDWAVVHK